MVFIPIDFPREVLELSGMDGARGYRRIVRNQEELESYWRGKNGSGDVYFTAYGYRGTQAPKHHRVDYVTPIIHHFVMDFDCKDFRKKGIDVPFHVPHEQVNDWFERDIQVSISDCKQIFDDFDGLPEEIQRVLANMSFQLGRPTLNKFKNMIAAVNNNDYQEMANQMEDSRWYKQTPNRAQRLIDRVLTQGIPH